MNTLQVGFSRVNVTPMLGIGMAGYQSRRNADGVLDELEINALAVACGDGKAVLIAIDHCGIVKSVLNPMRQHICDVTGLPWEAVYIHATHIFISLPIKPPMKQHGNGLLLKNYLYFNQHFFRSNAVNVPIRLCPLRHLVPLLLLPCPIPLRVHKVE